jgi:hypothetical protein
MRFILVVLFLLELGLAGCSPPSASGFTPPPDPVRIPAPGGLRANL